MFRSCPRSRLCLQLYTVTVTAGVSFMVMLGSMVSSSTVCVFVDSGVQHQRVR